MTTTMLETFDTQMLDYQNDDYAMHSDPWFQDETNMEDDGSQPENNNISVEVDMEPYDEGHNTEYEMADGSENYHLEEPDVPDVEVYDASRVHSPVAVLTADPPTLPPSDIADNSNAAAESMEPLLHNISPVLQPRSLPDASAPRDTPTSDAVASSIRVGHPEQPEEYFDVPGIHHTNVMVENLSSVYDPEPGDNRTSVAPEVEPASATGPDHPVDYTNTEDQHLEHNDALNTTETEHLNQVTGDADVASSAENMPEFHDENEELDAEHGTLATASSDPHEISEGVYIDPPPPVLMSFAFMDHPEISLFNAPPRLESSPDEPHADCTVLLAHLPILYYEPLCSVFDALRQDEQFANIPEFLHDELVFNAYDLELSISEDNIYAREVSLHDLNVLHDTLNTPGPLRLRLQVVTPRFMVRYHLLQAHVAQLSISDSKEIPIALVSESEEKQVHVSQAAQENTEEDKFQDDLTIKENLGEDKHDEVLQHPNHEDALTKDNHDEEKAVSFTGNSKNQGDDTVEVGLEYNATKNTDEDGFQREEDTESIEQAAEAGNIQAINNSVVTSEELVYPDDGAEGQPEEDDEDYDRNLPVQDHDYLEYPQILPQVPNDTIQDSNTDSADAGYATPRQTEPDFSIESVDHTGNADDIPQLPESGRLESNIHDPISSTSDPGITDIEPLHNLDVSDLHFTALKRNADEPVSSSKIEKETVTETLEIANTEYEDWDDDLDGEGDPDISWLEHETSSNQSSITLSSKTSSKRGISEVELGEEVEDERSPPVSPGLKRPRVQ